MSDPTRAIPRTVTVIVLLIALVAGLAWSRRGGTESPTLGAAASPEWCDTHWKSWVDVSIPAGTYTGTYTVPDSWGHVLLSAVEVRYVDGSTQVFSVTPAKSVTATLTFTQDVIARRLQMTPNPANPDSQCTPETTTTTAPPETTTTIVVDTTTTTVPQTTTTTPGQTTTTTTPPKQVTVTPPILLIGECGFPDFPDPQPSPYYDWVWSDNLGPPFGPHKPEDDIIIITAVPAPGVILVGQTVFVYDISYPDDEICDETTTTTTVPAQTTTTVPGQTTTTTPVTLPLTR